MIYQALFSGHAGQGHQGSTKVKTRARVLVDTGATQNFVSERFVKRHDLRSFAGTAPLTVALADGKRLISNRMVDMTLIFGEYKYARHVHILPLGVSADVILGMPWLYSLGRFTCDMDNHEMSFVHKVGHGRPQRIVLQAQPDAPKLKGSKVLAYGKALHEIRLAQRLLRAKQGPSVEQVRAVTRAVRQGSENLYGYDHVDDPRESVGGDDPFAFLCYLLPSRDVEDKKGGAGQRTTEQGQTPPPPAPHEAPASSTGVPELISDSTTPRTTTKHRPQAGAPRKSHRRHQKEHHPHLAHSGTCQCPG